MHSKSSLIEVRQPQGAIPGEQPILWCNGLPILLPSPESLKYNGHVAESVMKWANGSRYKLRPTFPLIRSDFDSKFLWTFKFTCNTNDIHGNIAMWLLNLSMKKPAVAALCFSKASCSKSNKHREEGTQSNYCEVVNYHLETCATDNVIAEMDAVITTLHSPQI